MTRRTRLIAQREFCAYAGSASFWLALLTGPLLMGLAALLLASSGGAKDPPLVRTVAIAAADPVLEAAAEAALRDVGGLEGWRFAPAVAGEKAVTALRVTHEVDGPVRVLVTGEPVSLLAATLLRRDLSRAAAEAGLRAKGVPAAALAVGTPEVQVDLAPQPAGKAGDPGAPGRFALMMLLWMNLVGALGMLMQAIVRERTNRALESLLSAARPSEILFGKLLGVGAVSILIICAWGAGAGLLAAVADTGGASPVGGVLKLLLSAWRQPAALMQAGLVYTLAFIMYGSALVAIGAMARDLPAAQNLARPVFALLLIVFFAALGTLGQAGASLGWLVWAPPFTPFMLLLAPAESMGSGQRVAALALLAVCALATACLAPRSLEDRRRFANAAPQEP